MSNLGHAFTERHVSLRGRWAGRSPRARKGGRCRSKTIQSVLENGRNSRGSAIMRATPPQRMASHGGFGHVHTITRRRPTPKTASAAMRLKRREPRK